MAGPDRRRFLTLGAAAAAGLAVSNVPLARAGERSGRGLDLVPDPNGIVDLLPGFRYRVLADARTVYSDGTRRPGDADGMGAFPGPGRTTVLCLNHELSDGEPSPVPPVAGHYDPRSSGGTSVLWVGRDRELLESRVSSSGTTRNCAGGITPWNTWISVEESVRTNGPYSHGWAFEVDPYAPLGGGTPRQVRLDALGRFFKEAATVDPHTRAVYQTEDLSDGLWYRFLPAPGTFPSGFGDYVDAAGELQALVVPGLPDADAARQGDVFTPRWARVPDPTGTPTPTRRQTYVDDLGAVVQPTVFYRGEGSWWSARERAVYFDATGGGSSGHRGQVWRYVPERNELTLVFVSRDSRVLDQPDNLVVLPWGDVLLCEDGSGPDYLRVLTRGGEIFDFARTRLAEFAGACWSFTPPTLFVNIQAPSITLAIWGPWRTFIR